MKKLFLISFVCFIFASCANDALPDGGYRLYNSSQKELSYSVNNQSYILGVGSEALLSQEPSLQLDESQYVYKTIQTYVKSNAWYRSQEIATKPLLTYTFNILYSKSFSYYDGKSSDLITVDYSPSASGNLTKTISISSYTAQTIKYFDSYNSEITAENNIIKFFGFSGSLVVKDSDYSYKLYN